MYKVIFYLSILGGLLMPHSIYAGDMKALEQDISDSIITTKITAKFAENRNLNPLKVSINTEHGIVTLKGYVTDKRAFVDALRIAKNTKGVIRVKAVDLNINKVNTAFTDAFITAKVETAVLKAKVFDDESIPLVGINATTSNGIVTLSGKVNSGQSVAAIIKRVNNVHGVAKIISRIEVKDCA
jgi:hyperosmotically inducible protein